MQNGSGDITFAREGFFIDTVVDSMIAHGKEVLTLHKKREEQTANQNGYASIADAADAVARKVELKEGVKKGNIVLGSRSRFLDEEDDDDDW